MLRLFRSQCPLLRRDVFAGLAAAQAKCSHVQRCLFATGDNDSGEEDSAVAGEAANEVAGEVVESIPSASPSPPTSTDAQNDQHEGDKKEASFVDDEDIEKAVLESQTASPDETASPFESGFPLNSPLTRKEDSSDSILKRDQFLKKLFEKRKSLAKSNNEASDDEEEKDADKKESPIDVDTGFAELGGFSTQSVTGLVLDEDPMRIHPRRYFQPGQTYQPEELHPFGAYREKRLPSKSRTIRDSYAEDDIKDKLSFKNLSLLNNYLSDAGLILPRRITRLSKKVQTKLERSVKTAQALALLPVLDRREEFKRRTRRVSEKDLIS